MEMFKESQALHSDRGWGMHGVFHVAKLKSEAYLGLGQDFIQMAAQAVTAYYL